MTELQRAEDLALPGTLSATGYELPEGMELDEWMRVGGTLKLIGKAVQWWVGDWLAYGEDHYGESAFQAVERADKTFANWASVCRRIPLSRRREDLSFSHHAEVTKLDPVEQKEALEIAAREELTVRAVRDYVAEKSQQVAEKEHGKAEVVKTRTCPQCGGAGEIPLD